MRKLMTVMVLFVGALVLPMAAKADSVTATATYASGTSYTVFSAPGRTITFSFNIPGALTDAGGFLEALNVPVSVSFGGKTISETAELFFFTNNDGGLFNLFFGAGLSTYEWDFFGAQIFNSQDQLIKGIYPVNTAYGGYFKDFGFGGYGTFSSGSVQVGAVPEPTSLLLLGIGLLGIVPAARKRFGARKPAASNVQ